MHNIINNNIHISEEDIKIFSEARPTLDKIMTEYSNL